MGDGDPLGSLFSGVNPIYFKMLCQTSHPRSLSTGVVAGTVLPYAVRTIQLTGVGLPTAVRKSRDHRTALQRHTAHQNRACIRVLLISAPFSREYSEAFAVENDPVRLLIRSAKNSNLGNLECVKATYVLSILFTECKMSSQI